MGLHMALEPPFGVQILSHWTPLHVGLMPEWFGSINTSISIPTFHSAVIRIQGLALNSAKMGSKNSAMCRSLRTDDRRQSSFCSRVTRIPAEVVGRPPRSSDAVAWQSAEIARSVIRWCGTRGQPLLSGDNMK